MKKNNKKDKELIEKEKLVPKKKKQEEEIKKAKRNKIITIILLILVFLVSLTALFFFVIYKEEKITNFTDKEKILVGEDYKDKEFNICYGTIVNCKKVKYTIDGNVDTKVLGDYTLIYHYKINDKEKTLK